MVIEYRIEKRGTNVQLWCKIKGYFNQNISSQGFFVIFSVVNKIMMIKQLKNIKTLAERLTRGQVETRTYDFAHCYAQSGIHWWLFCRRHNCKGLIIEPVSD